GENGHRKVSEEPCKKEVYDDSVDRFVRPDRPGRGDQGCEEKYDHSHDKEEGSHQLPNPAEVSHGIRPTLRTCHIGIHGIGPCDIGTGNWNQPGDMCPP